tara:strand:- start:854 stop:1078 length:225 start_codon:yes stop_codon:yes gene_type:complete
MENEIGSIKRLKCDSDVYKLVKISGEVYREYEVGNLPSKFGTWQFGETDGIGTWFCNHAKGLTYINAGFFGKLN